MAFEKIEQGIPIQEISNPAGGGNGMMMKQFPLAAYFDVKNSDPKVEEKAILDITKVSHGHPAALVAAIVHHYFLKELLDANTQEIDKKSLLQKMKCIAQAQESKFIPREGKKISEVIEQIQAHINDKNELTLRDEEIYEQFGRGDNMKQS
jgi:ADP-ribosylglycohydrolase